MTRLYQRLGIDYLSLSLYIFAAMLTFIVNEKSSKGKTLLEFARKLEPSDKEIRIRKFRKMTDEEMALPGKPVSKEQLDEWLNRRIKVKVLPLNNYLPG